MNNLRILLTLVAGLSLAAPPLIAQATDGEQIKAQHREAAQRYLSSLEPGVTLKGTVLRNDSPGQFTAYHYDGAWLVKQSFGAIEWLGYTGAEGSWSGSNYGLPYEVEPDDSPANSVLELLTDGRYLEEPWWECFSYVEETAGAYVFSFTPPDLPPVSVELYSDPDEPQYLQVMSVELPMAQHDDTCVTYRAYYYYTVDEAGRILTERETGREVDDNGETINYVEYSVEETGRPEQRPAEMDFNFERQPFSRSAAALEAPVTVPARTGGGYFIVPLTFAGSDETFWFLLDTGASSSLLDPAAAEAAGLEPVLSLPTHGHGSRAEFALGLCTTASLGEAGSDSQAPLDGFTATAIPEGNDVLGAFRFYGVSGLLGIAPLHQYVTTFDHPGGALTLTPPQLFDPAQIPTEHLYVLDLDVEDLIYCPARLNDELEGEVMIDSGLQQDLALLRETVELHEVEMTTIDERANTVVGGVRNFEYVQLPSFELLSEGIPEGHRALRMDQALASLTEDNHGTLSGRGLLGFVGMTMFLDVKVTLDLFGQRMYYEVPPDMVRADEEAEDGAGDGEESWPAEAGEEAADEDDGGTKLPVNIN